MNLHIGRAMGWLMFLLVAVVTVDVISRYLFNTGAVVVQEGEWWLFSIIFLSAAGFTFVTDSHVRVDIIYSRLTKRNRNWVDLISSFVFLFPMCALIIYTSYPFIRDSWNVGEVSPDPGGIPMLYVLKTFIPLGFFLLGLQGVARVVRTIRELNDEAATPEGEATRS